MVQGPRLTPSRSLDEHFGIDARVVAEQDESCWADHKRAVFSDKPPTVRDLLPDPLKIDPSRCLVDGVLGQTLNIRTYLSLYKEALIALPDEQSYGEFLHSLGVTEDELVWLTTIGRVTLVLPQSLDRYDPSLINRVASDCPSGLLLSRRLALATVADTRNRFPLAYPGLDAGSRISLLRGIEKNLQSASPAERPFAEALRNHLSAAWMEEITSVSRGGALATAQHGAAPLIAEMLRIVHGRELWMELVNAGAAVEWAGALRATLFPARTDRLSLQKSSEVVSAVYSGMPDSPAIDVNFGKADTALRGILAIDNDASLRDFVSAMDGESVDRLRTIVRSIAEANLDDEFLQNAIDTFNERVRTFERRDEKLRSLDLLTAAGVIVGAATHQPLIGLGGWALKYLVRNPQGGRIHDALNALATWSPTDAILVSRIGKRLK